MDRILLSLLVLIGIAYSGYVAFAPSSTSDTPTAEPAELENTILVDAEAAYLRFEMAAEDRDALSMRSAVSEIIFLTDKLDINTSERAQLLIDIADEFAGADFAGDAATYYGKALSLINADSDEAGLTYDKEYLAEVRLRNAMALAEAGEIGRAFDELAGSISIATDALSPDLYDTLGLNAAWTDAANSLSDKIENSNAASLSIIGRYFLAAEDFQLAVDYLSAALSGAATRTAADLSDLAAAYAGVGEYEAAISTQQKAINAAQTEGTNEGTRLALRVDYGRYQLGAGLVSEAIETLQAASSELDFALSSSPNDPVLIAAGAALYPALADALRERGDEDAALALEESKAPFFAAAADGATTKGVGIEREEWTEYTLYYGTTRARSEKSNPSPASFYSNKKTVSGERGTVTVTVPKQHEIGSIEKPGWMTVFGRRDKRKFIVMQQPGPLSEDLFLDALRAAISQTDGRTALIFIHGYNTSFHDAARLTAQLSHDLELNAVPMFYSWPSRAKLLGYGADLNTWPSAREDLRNFIRDAAERSGAEKVHIIAHSMGNKYLLDALSELWLIYDEGENIPKSWALGEVVFAAPDVEAAEFVKAMNYATGLAERTTLYASQNDKALKLSRRVNAGRRAGDSRSGITIAEGLTSIDATDAKTDFLGHGYFASGASILTDIRALLSLGVEPARRCYLEQQDQRAHPFWVYKTEPPYCSANAYDWAMYLFLQHNMDEDPSTAVKQTAEELISQFQNQAAAFENEGKTDAASTALRNASLINLALEILDEYFFRPE